MSTYDDRLCALSWNGSNNAVLRPRVGKGADGRYRA